MENTNMIIGRGFDLNDESGDAQKRSDVYGDRTHEQKSKKEQKQKRKAKKARKQVKQLNERIKDLEKTNNKLQSKNSKLKEQLRYEEALAPIRMHAMQSDFRLKFLVGLLSKGDRERFAALPQGFIDIIPVEDE